LLFLLQTTLMAAVADTLTDFSAERGSVLLTSLLNWSDEGHELCV